MSGEKLEETGTIIRISGMSTQVELTQENTSCSVSNLIISEGNLIRIHKGLSPINNIGGKIIKLVFSDSEEVDLPEDIYRRLLGYINNEEIILSVRKGEVDCNSFVSFVYGIGMGNRSEIFRITEKKIFSEIKSGDILFLENRLDYKQGNYHFALYLGKGLYISKFPNQGIGITDINELKDLYNSTNISVLTKKL